MIHINEKIEWLILEDSVDFKALHKKAEIRLRTYERSLKGNIKKYPTPIEIFILGKVDLSGNLSVFEHRVIFGHSESLFEGERFKAESLIENLYRNVLLR